VPALMLHVMEAAFFDLDKTVIAKASMVAFGPPLYRAGMISRWLVARALWSQFVFQRLGADEERMRKFRESALRITRGWDQATINAIVRDTLTEIIDPIVYDEALDLIRQHQAAGRRVYLISASPEEIVAPLARYLQVDEAIASRAMLDDEGRYTGEVEFYSYGPFKAEAMRDAATLRGIDLEASYAYSDSATDIPMLEAVGHPVAVNPDRELARVARERGWEVRQFRHGVPLRERVNMPPPARAAAGAATIVVVMAAGGAAWWLWRRRAKSHATEPPGNEVATMARSAAEAAAIQVTDSIDHLWRRAPEWSRAARTAANGVRRPGASSPRRRRGQRRR
jgi:HAD superfamily hydrolase (TIGR01490 family)